MLDVLLSVFLSTAPASSPAEPPKTPAAIEASSPQPAAEAKAPDAPAEAGASQAPADKPAADASSPKAAGKLACALRVAPKGKSAVLTAYAISPDGPRSGTYQLRVEKTGGGGTATIQQGSDFALQPGKEKALSNVTLGAKDRFTADLSVSWEGGTVTCTQNQPGSSHSAKEQQGSGHPSLPGPEDPWTSVAPQRGAENTVSVQQGPGSLASVRQSGSGNTVQIRQSR